MNIWNLYKGERFIQSLNAMPWRVAITSLSFSMRSLVDSFEESVLLEELLQKVDPKSQAVHDLFASFYYPSLKMGSRFAKKYEPPLWYGGLTQKGAFEEAAFYLKKFHQDTTANLGYIEMTLSSYQTIVNTSSGIDLTVAPFDLYQDKISSSDTYIHSQRLGYSLRKSGINAAFYYSARTHAPEKNLVVFTPEIIHKNEEQYTFNQQFWACIATTELVELRRLGFDSFSFLM